VHGTLEDPAGNRVGSRFESAVGARLKPAADVLVVFEVASPAPSTVR